MAFRCLKLLRIIRSTNVIRHNLITTSVALSEEVKIHKPKEYKTEDNLVYAEDPDTFGTLSRIVNTKSEQLEDAGDIKEQEFIQNKPLRTQKLTIRQYADLIKQFISHKRLKEAIDVLETRMLKEDRVKPENYIYNILIGACADVGYTKKAFKLFNDMKKRALLPTGDTYTCLFHACANSPWPADGLMRAKHLKELMAEKGYEPNITNYNSMIKAFGRCGDLPTAFMIVDEMASKRIKLRVHTLNHLLHACISDKQNGLRHALIVWRKMLKLKEKPNIFSFNLMLKCVKDCNLGNKQDIEELIGVIQDHIQLQNKNSKQLKLAESTKNVKSLEPDKQKLIEPSASVTEIDNNNEQTNVFTSDISIINKKDDVSLQFVNKLDKVVTNEATVPNLLSKVLNMEQVTGLQEIHTLQDKFAVVGGQEDFLKEMQTYSVKPNIKTFTQMLPLLENTTEAEDRLLQTMKTLGIRADIDFYNMLIKKRCLRSDYDSAFAVQDIIEKESDFRKKRFPFSKNLKLKLNIMSYGVLAMGCKTKESAEKLLKEMEEKHLKVNIEILGTLLRHGTASSNFGYVLYIMNVVKKENIKLNDIFLKHLVTFNDKCCHIINKKEHVSETFKKAYEIFAKYYSTWLKEVNVEGALKPEHPWQQYRENYPETVQRSPVQIKEPKRFYKRNKKFSRYTPQIVN
ncbi:pentatricopeptide repeat-containing protein 1, mitochondrial [Spodoptera litura]|uniref:Pentatricopeptide repeat-containing protein 1, mitochondrial n=1 Tax=Spodoptera litura TaxID=69820 RepID=A0A9J7J0R4_SPOLT|nr:pentatricopeptide repeat-containing protein 1, mitochondrial [Spodoptera litura]